MLFRIRVVKDYVVQDYNMFEKRSYIKTACYVGEIYDVYGVQGEVLLCYNSSKPTFFTITAEYCAPV